ncbi:hypothetical protein [Mesorhizobium sp. L-8-3]|uniref:hypothetical protein n=1 Tax=Mesorhizobium sp. L-8-3 TaxID=2744522 RepID=UPI0019270C7A|nr:hypothetical protein [Mesorhizobium sp. L-8-3]BCH20650.1 hypothetical protein MesoLjLb_04350 [Mesorhizobium sp. L-8-3]
MNGLTMSLRPTNAYFRAGTAAILTLVLTSVHHAYGAMIYETPWRLHILHVAVPTAVAIALLLCIGFTRRGKPGGRLATWAAIAIIMAFPVAAIGVFEGGYNHVLKNLVYFGFGAESAKELFPPPTYEMPNDIVFELTGIAQFPLCVLAAVFALRLLRMKAG